MADHDHYITPEAMRIIRYYPGLFGPGTWPVNKTQLDWGFTCADGWYPILDCLFADVDRIREENGLTRLEVLQVKENFGELRGDNERVSARVCQAVEEALST